MGIDAPIAAEIAAGKFSEIEPIVQNWPEHAISEAVVIFLIVGFAEIGDDVGHVATLNRPGRHVSLGRNGPAPAEPETAVVLEQGSNSDHQASISQKRQIRNAVAGRPKSSAEA